MQKKYLIMLIVILFIMIPEYYITEVIGVPINLFFGILSFGAFVNLLVSYFIIHNNNDFDDIECENCKISHTIYDKYCFNCGILNLKNPIGKKKS